MENESQDGHQNQIKIDENILPTFHDLFVCQNSHRPRSILNDLEVQVAKHMRFENW